jgi:hypothetical protein
MVDKSLVLKKLSDLSDLHFIKFKAAILAFLEPEK